MCRAVVGWLMGFLAAVQFLTIAPPLVRRPFSDRELGRAVGGFALVGLLLGALLAVAASGLSRLFPPGVTAALVLVCWALATGLLHLDGFLDSCDGLFGGRTPESRLRIMRDERVGAYAVIGGALLLLVKYACLTALTDQTIALLLAPTLGRAGMALAVVAFPYARPEGLGRTIKDHAGWREVLACGVVVFLALLFTMSWSGVIALAVAVLVVLAGARFVLRRIPGLTGDIYGTLCELAEVTSLLVFVACERA
jgi:adenosylcobinamide-GDP ribazoletransferase